MTGSVLILGSTGMLGHTLLRHLVARGIRARGTVRAPSAARLGEALARYVVPGVDARRLDSVRRALDDARPDTVVNCIGLIKQLPEAKDPVQAIELNALFPHVLHGLCRERGVRLVHVGTDCVFSGRRGGYRESDLPDPEDLYGRTKLLGEVDGDGALTLRTSIIGHELGTRYGLVEWFLSQHAEVRGFTRTIYSGLPTIELASVIAEHVLTRRELGGLYQVSSAPITKHALLGLIAQRYGRSTRIVPASEPACDRSLDSSRFRAATGYAPPPWPELISRMHQDHLASSSHP